MISLVPAGDLAEDTSVPHRWAVTGPRPRFRVDGPLAEGWYRLTARYVAEDTHPGEPLGPQLRLTGLAGPVSAVSRPLGLRGDRIDRVVHLPAELDELYIDLPITARSVDLDQLDCRPLRQSAAARRMAGRVLGTSVEGWTQTASLVSRAWESLRLDGVTGLREQLVADYEAVQRRRAGLVAIPYREWIEYHDVRDIDDDAAIDDHIAAMVDPPTISVVVPVYDPPPDLLDRCIESVRAQRYPHWQLCLADDASTDPEISAVLDRHEAADERIVTERRPRNGHIAAASNSALALATGDYVALLDHDDELPDHALYLVAAALDADPTLDLVYTDEDKIDDEGRRFDPHFKPDYNPELLLGQNYLSHLTTLRRSLVDEVGGFREGTEGSQDYDLFLRVIAHSTAERIGHVPMVGYHWRAIEGSTARATAEKGYAVDAALRALRDHVPAGWTVEEASAPTTYRARPPLPDPVPSVSIVVPTRNGWPLVDTLMTSLDATDYPRFDVLIIDNQSDDPAALAGFARLEADGRARVMRYDRPFNYSAINNIGVAHTDGELVCLLNNDIEATDSQWLTEMVRHARRSEIGAVGAKLLYPDRTIQHAGVVLGLGGVAGHGHRQFPADAPGYFSRLAINHAVGAVTAACLVVRRSVWDEVGGLDDDELAVAFNDVDLCLKIAAAGYRNLLCVDAVLLHHESISRGAEDTPEKQARFAREIGVMLDRWGPELLDDPAYNPNLALDADAFTLAREPRSATPWRRRAGSLGR
ncbi:MAG: glycosyltransferase family 2 protein [Acidimicrobiia bacterium]|nr:glycosyltransferase family 2 protein [Acidimicrobiia bacterium]